MARCCLFDGGGVSAIPQSTYLIFRKWENVGYLQFKRLSLQPTGMVSTVLWLSQQEYNGSKLPP